MPVTQIELRTQFFDYLFGDEQSGYFCVATASPAAIENTFKHFFFAWPDEKIELAEFIEKNMNKHQWFCVSLLRNATEGAVKSNCLPGSFIWADLDEVTPDDLKSKSLPATSILETSPGSFQGFWRLGDIVNGDPLIIPAETRAQLSKKVTYYTGADKGGWQCNKLLRIPYTINWKYKEKPRVDLLFAYETYLPISALEGLPDAPLSGEVDELIPDMPDVNDLYATEVIIYKYAYNLRDTPFVSLFKFEPEPNEDWSAKLWRFINICFEAGMDSTEVFTLSMDAACNKYKRDSRPDAYLWHDVIKAEKLREKSFNILGDYRPLAMPLLVDQDLDFTNLVTEYKAWAVTATDAVAEYHELCAFILMSCISSAGIVLNASFGKLIPNLWGMVLGDSTLTRKTTAMDMAMSFLREVDEDAIVTTDGSPEGLIQALSQRHDQVSVYFKDEVSGLFSAINNKSYLSDMPEVLTKMYDVPEYYPRTLSKSTVTVRNPYFIFFGGGIKEKVYAQLRDDFVISGFLPRFLIVNGEADLASLRPTGPPNEKTIAGRAHIASRINRMYSSYSQIITTKVGSQMIPMPASLEALLSPESWEYFSEIEQKLWRAADAAHNKMVAQPTLNRLAFSLLKMAILLAASRGPDKQRKVNVVKSDLEQAAWYVQRWGRHSIDLINNAGISQSERELEKVLKTIRDNAGCNKSYIMNAHRMKAKDMTELLQTMTDRGLIQVRKAGRGFRFWIVD